jgi:beta-lactam-binding protein with PASTA domain
MEKKKKNILLRIISNTYVKNILLMVVILVLLVVITLFGLKKYTKHDEFVIVPDVKGLQEEEAAGILKSNTLSYEISDSIFLAEGKPGAIIEQIPKEDLKVKKGRTVFLIVQAKEQQMIKIPSLQDYSQRQAEAQLNALGFNKITITEAPSRYKGIVLSIEYKGRKIEADQKVPKGAPLKMIIGSGGGESETDSVPTDTNVETPFFE